MYESVPGENRRASSYPGGTVRTNGPASDGGGTRRACDAGDIADTLSVDRDRDGLSVAGHGRGVVQPVRRDQGDRPSGAEVAGCPAGLVPEGKRTNLAGMDEPAARPGGGRRVRRIGVASPGRHGRSRTEHVRRSRQPTKLADVAEPDIRRAACAVRPAPSNASEVGDRVQHRPGRGSGGAPDRGAAGARSGSQAGGQTDRTGSGVVPVLVRTASAARADPDRLGRVDRRVGRHRQEHRISVCRREAGGLAGGRTGHAGYDPGGNQGYPRTDERDAERK